MACGLLMSFIAVSAPAQGLSFETMHQNDEAKVSKNLYMPGMFRSEEWDGHISILRLDKEMILSIAPAQRTYTEITFAQMETQLKLSRTRGMGMGMGRSAFASLEKIDGFPIEQSGTSTSEKIRKIQAGSFPMSAFEVPPGYTKEKTRSLGEEK